MMRALKMAALLFACAASPALAGDISDVFGKSSNPDQGGVVYGGPPAGYADQHWVSSDGCSYSRAKAPGFAPTWHLMLNAAHVGLTDAHSGCTIMYTQIEE